MMTNAEPIKALRDCAATWNTIDYCDVAGCPFAGYGSMCIDTMLEAAADAFEAADEKITKLKNPKVYIAVDFKGDYVLCQANYVYSDGTRLSSEIAKVRIPLEDSEHGMNLGYNIVIAAERKDDE
jgi:hypothetical protein